jgi:uncharacterized surface protein with fasciclin (FAS1) repeats
MSFNRIVLAAALALFAAPALAQEPSPGTAASLSTAPAPAEQAPPAAATPAATVTLAPHGDIADTLKASDQFTILAKALDATNLTSVLKRPGPMTLLAPTDTAFKALPAGQLDSLMKQENASQLQALLAYHIINAAVPPSAIQGKKGPVKTVIGKDVQIDGSANPITVNGAAVVGQASVSNGTIYVIDHVLDPNAPAAAAAPPASSPAPATP